ncbi:MAG: WD40/YVTN/BNR-like repeat-containing protein [Candidatus Dormibacteria bacterium]
MAVLKRVFLAVASAVLVGAAVIPASAADLQWTSYGSLPSGVPSFSLAQDPSAPASTWAATNGQGLQHTDDGKLWRQVPGGVLPARLWRIAIDPSKGPSGPPPMYVGSAGQGFFKSLDNGKTWQGSTQGLVSSGARNVRAIAMGVGTLVLATSDGAYRSADGGRSWQSAGLAGMDVSTVAFVRFANPAVLVAGIDGISNPGSRAVMSKDLGATWTPLKQGLPTDMVVSAVVAGPLPAGASSRPVFLAGSAGVFKSDDGGQGWGQLSSLPPQGYGTLAVSPADPNIVYAGSDGGGGTGGGVWRSSDRGGTWTAIPGGLTEKGVTALSVGRDNPATVVVAAWNPDKNVNVAFSLSDTQATPQGQPEGGVCPEPSCQGGTQAPASPTATAAASPSPSTPICVNAPAPAPTAGGAVVGTPSAASASPGNAQTPTPGTPCPTAGPKIPAPSRPNIALPVAAGVVLVLAGILLGSIALTRLRG